MVHDLLPDEIFNVWYENWRKELMVNAPFEHAAGDVSILIKLTMLEELKELREEKRGSVNEPRVCNCSDCKCKR